MQQVPISLEFLAMNFCPGLDQSLLCPGEAPADALDRIYREHACRLLIVGMKMGTVMRHSRFDEHSNHDSEEARDFRHLFTNECLVSIGICRANAPNEPRAKSDMIAQTIRRVGSI